MAAPKRHLPASNPTASRPSKRVKTTSQDTHPVRKPYSKSRQATQRATALVNAANALPLPRFTAAYIPAALRTHARSASSANTNTTDSTPPLSLALHSTATLSPADLDALVALVEETSGADYAASGAGWHRARKAAEMAVPAMRFLLVHADRTPPSSDTGGSSSAGGGGGMVEDGAAAAADTAAGFLSFTLSVEAGEAVLYVYELHLRAWARGCGAGAWLLGVAEGVGRRVGVAKAMLTVFATNARAEALYRRRGYEEDWISPAVPRTRSGAGRPEYFILSKRLDGEDASGGGDVVGPEERSDEQNGVRDGNGVTDANGDRHGVDKAVIEGEFRQPETEDEDRAKKKAKLKA